MQFTWGLFLLPLFATSMAAPANAVTKLYFAYGSNLSPTQMTARCPNSEYVGIGLIRGWKWQINTRRYANVVQTSPDYNITIPSITPLAETDSDRVYGLIYALRPTDEHALDGYEGVPNAYTKEMVEMEFWSKDLIPDSLGGDEKWFLAHGALADKLDALVYVDRKRTEEGKPYEEYVGRMKRGIKEAGEKGWPTDWARRAMGDEYFD